MLTHKVNKFVPEIFPRKTKKSPKVSKKLKSSKNDHWKNSKIFPKCHSFLYMFVHFVGQFLLKSIEKYEIETFLAEVE